MGQEAGDRVVSPGFRALCMIRAFARAAIVDGGENRLSACWWECGGRAGDESRSGCVAAGAGTDRSVRSAAGLGVISRGLGGAGGQSCLSRFSHCAGSFWDNDRSKASDLFAKPPWLRWSVCRLGFLQ